MNVTKRVKVLIAHEVSTEGNYSIEELDSMVRELLKEGTSDGRFWDLGRNFCYEDSYPVEMTISTSFE